LQGLLHGIISMQFFIRPSAALALLLAVISHAVAQDRDAKPLELLVTVDQGIGFGGMFSRGPRLAIYRDNTIIYAKQVKKGESPVYFIGKLPRDEARDLSPKLKALRDLGKQELDLAPGWHDLPHMKVSHFFDPEGPVVQYVYGYAPTGYDGPAASSGEARKRPDKLPPEFDAAAQALIALDPDGAKQWQPDLIEVQLVPQKRSKNREITTWPAAWPNIDDKTTTQGSGVASLVVPGSDQARVQELYGEPVLIGESVWAIARWEPMLPGTERWTAYQKARGK
jgi:hypothetical protein